MERGPVRPDLGLVRILPIVEGGLALDTKSHAAARNTDSSNQQVAVVLQIGAHGHKVDDLADSVIRQKPRQQNVGVGPIHLLLGCFSQWLDYKMAAAVCIENRPEHAWRVEPWKTEPINRTVLSHEGDGTKISNYPVVFNGLISHRIYKSSRRLSSEQFVFQPIKGMAPQLHFTLCHGYQHQSFGTSRTSAAHRVSARLVGHGRGL